MKEGIAMDMQELKSLIYQGEKVDIECKKAEGLPKPFKLEGIQRIDETPLHKAVREAFVNLIIHADYLMDAGTLKVIKKNRSFEFTNPGILKLPVEDIFRGGNSKPRNSHMQTMLRMVGFGDNAGSGFPTIVAAWDAEGWVKPELIEDTILNQVTLKLDMVKAENAVQEASAVLKSAEEMPKSAEVEHMTEQEKTIFEYVREQEMITTAIACKLLNIKERRAREILSEMCNKNYLKKKGATSNLRYIEMS